jgi:hypothetical protein
MAELDDTVREFWYTHRPKLNARELQQFFPIYSVDELARLCFEIDTEGEIYWTPPLVELLNSITTPFDRRSLNVIAKEHGFDAKFHREQLRKNARYKEAYGEMIKTSGKEAEGEILRRLLAEAAGGNEKARETYLKLSGFDLAQKLVVTNTGDRILESVITVLQRHLDPDTLADVALDLREIDRTRELPPPGKMLF